jgi:hypothetical protein
MLYGFCSYLLGPSIGASFGRLIGYGWPMAWFAAPELLVRYFRLDERLIGRFAALQATTCWMPLVLKEIGVSAVPADATALAIGLLCQIFTWRMLSQNRLPEVESVQRR